jgi:hypothetical protein
MPSPGGLRMTEPRLHPGYELRRAGCGIPPTCQRATTWHPWDRADRDKCLVTSRAAPGAPRGRGRTIDGMPHETHSSRSGWCRRQQKGSTSIGTSTQRTAPAARRPAPTGPAATSASTHPRSHQLVGSPVGDRGLQTLVIDETALALRALVDHRDDLVKARTQTVNRLHRLLIQLIPAGAPQRLSAQTAVELLTTVDPQAPLAADPACAGQRPDQRNPPAR